MEVQSVLSQISSSHFYHNFSEFMDALLILCYIYQLILYEQLGYKCPHAIEMAVISDCILPMLATEPWRTPGREEYLVFHNHQTVATTQGES